MRPACVAKVGAPSCSLASQQQVPVGLGWHIRTRNPVHGGRNSILDMPTTKPHGRLVAICPLGGTAGGGWGVGGVNKP